MSNMKSISDVVQYEVICTPILTLLSRSKNSSFRPQGRKLLFLSYLSVFGPRQQCMGVHITEYCTILKSISCWNISAQAMPKTALKVKKYFCVMSVNLQNIRINFNGHPKYTVSTAQIIGSLVILCHSKGFCSITQYPLKRGNPVILSLSSVMNSSATKG